MKHNPSSKQNQRISRISETTLVIGTDIAKHQHVARAFNYRGLLSLCSTFITCIVLMSIIMTAAPNNNKNFDSKINYHDPRIFSLAS
ncbi:MAG: hypothetical protein BLM47_09875 [Candidatus Reconcilbacillus cellulovorans]|uniref:Uncharacterized protein n=1 Tax=Candidatus Reconcilbacillus cellulovorans TaxID=1906605 RepID=A0A2A6DYX0_9BACL|nr:MAG: hypothetical protein BLM47_09875 [Candidatus Reconcilbacillus cellulovorans]